MTKSEKDIIYLIKYKESSGNYEVSKKGDKYLFYHKKYKYKFLFAILHGDMLYLSIERVNYKPFKLLILNREKFSYNISVFVESMFYNIVNDNIEDCYMFFYELYYHLSNNTFMSLSMMNDISYIRLLTDTIYNMGLVDDFREYLSDTKSRGSIKNQWYSPWNTYTDLDKWRDVSFTRDLLYQEMEYLNRQNILDKIFNDD